MRAATCRCRRASPVRRGSVAPFVIRSGLDEVMGVAAAGVEMINSENSVLRFAYEGQIGESTQIHSVSLRASAQF